MKDSGVTSDSGGGVWMEAVNGELMEQGVVFCDRAVKIEDGYLWLSRVGRYDDWDIFPNLDALEDEQAIVIALDSEKVSFLRVLDPDRIVINDRYVLVFEDGNPVALKDLESRP